MNCAAHREKRANMKQGRSRICRWGLVLSWSVWVSWTQVVQCDYLPFGFQSGAKAGSGADDSYAGSMFYDSSRGMVFVTGGTYSSSFEAQGSDSDSDSGHSDFSDCFLATLKLPPATDPAVPDHWLYARRLGSSGVHDVCSAMEVYTPDPDPSGPYVYDRSALFAIGHSQPGGLFSSLVETKLDMPQIFGFSMVMDLKFAANDNDNDNDNQVDDPSDATLVGGAVFQNSKVQYPVAIAHNLDRSNVYVAMLASDFDDLHTPVQTDLSGNDSHQHYDFTAGSGYESPIRGKDFSVMIKMLTLKTQDELATEPQREGVKEAFNIHWSREFEPVDDSSPRVADMIYVPTSTFTSGFLIIAGYTSGYGKAFGLNAAPNPPPTIPDVDTFVTKIHANSGNLAEDIGQTYTVRIQSKTPNGANSSGKRDEGKGLCVFQNPNGDPPTHFYLVGSTAGTFEDADSNPSGANAAFIIKLSIDTMQILWAKQISTRGTGGAVAYSCAVTPDGNDVYLAGTVYDGDTLDALGITDSAGGSDLFLASYKTSNGAVNWVKQKGTDKDDWLARGEGVTCDDEGNAILLASTRGNFYRWRGDDPNSSSNKDASDIALMSVKRSNGSWLATQDTSSPEPLTPLPHSSERSKKSPFRIFMIIFAICFGILLLMMAVYHIAKRSYTHDDDDWDGKHDNVMRYLEDFDDSKVELHIRHSATGGIHGIYDLDKKGHAYVDNNDEVTVHLTSAADHIDVDTDSVVKDALFMDDNIDISFMNGSIGTSIANLRSAHTIDDSNNDISETDSIAGSSIRTRRSYLGLVDSYNDTWAERSIHSSSQRNYLHDNSEHAERIHETTEKTKFISNSDGLSQLADKEFRDYDSGDELSTSAWGKEIV